MDSRKRRIRRVLESRRFEFILAFFIVASVILVFAEVLVPHDLPIHPTIVLASDALTGLFIVELFIRFYAETNKVQFFKKCWFDILAVLPGLRFFRFLRILRLLRLYRVTLLTVRQLQSYSPIFKLIRGEYLIIALALFTATMIGALSMRVAEGSSPDFSTIENTLWYAVMTIIAGEPTGGDPVTSGGKAITLSLMLSGLTLFAIFTGTVSAVMIDMLKNVRLTVINNDDLNRHVVICGWNASGDVLMRELLRDRDNRQFVIISEADTLLAEPMIQEHSSQILTIKGDYTRLDTLREAHIERANTAILLADATIPGRSPQDQDARTVLAAMLVERLNPEIYTIVQLNNRDNETSLKRMGVEEIIVSEEYVGNLVATMTRNCGIVSVINELLTASYGDQFFRCPVPAELVGVDVGRSISLLKRDYNATLLAVDLYEDQVAGIAVKVNPPTDFILEEHHYLFVAATEPLEPKRRGSIAVGKRHSNESV